MMLRLVCFSLRFNLTQLRKIDTGKYFWMADLVTLAITTIGVRRILEKRGFKGTYPLSFQRGLSQLVCGGSPPPPLSEVSGAKSGAQKLKQNVTSVCNFSPSTVKIASNGEGQSRDRIFVQGGPKR